MAFCLVENVSLSRSRLPVSLHRPRLMTARQFPLLSCSSPPSPLPLLFAMPMPPAGRAQHSRCGAARVGRKLQQPRLLGLRSKAENPSTTNTWEGGITCRRRWRVRSELRRHRSGIRMRLLLWHKPGACDGSTFSAFAGSSTGPLPRENSQGIARLENRLSLACVPPSCGTGTPPSPVFLGASCRRSWDGCRCGFVSSDDATAEPTASAAKRRRKTRARGERFASPLRPLYDCP